MKGIERKHQDWMLILLILLIGFPCVLLAGGWALRFSPSWKLNANMESKLDSNRDFLTRRTTGWIEPVDASILTPPSWTQLFLTPGAPLTTRTPFPAGMTTNTLALTSMPVLTNTVTPTATNARIYFPPTATWTPKPISMNGPTATPTFTSVAILMSTTSSTPTATIATKTFTPTNTPTATFTATKTYIPTNTPTATLTPTNTPPPIADLQMNKSDGASTYTANGTLIYTITVTNNGPSGVIGAVVADAIPTQISYWSWTCASQTGGASGCDGMNSNTTFNDTVSLPNGASITYLVNASLESNLSGDLTNTATVTLPGGYTDPVPGNNSAADTDQLLIASSFPSGNIGSTKDSSTSTVTPGSSVTLTFDAPLYVNGHAGYDLVYYELPAGSGILMDHVILQVSDGYNWYTIFNWGDNLGDANSNLNINDPAIGGSETDNRDTSASLLYNATGVAIELDGVVPNGTYPYIRILSPLGDDGDGCEVDAIAILP